MNSIRFGGVYQLTSPNAAFNRKMTDEMSCVWASFKGQVLEHGDTCLFVTNDAKGQDLDYATGRNNLWGKPAASKLIPKAIRMYQLAGRSQEVDVSDLEQRVKSLVDQAMAGEAAQKDVIEITDKKDAARSRRVVGTMITDALAAKGEKAKVFNLSGTVFVVKGKALERFAGDYAMYRHSAHMSFGGSSDLLANLLPSSKPTLGDALGLTDPGRYGKQLRGAMDTVDNIRRASMEEEFETRGSLTDQLRQSAATVDMTDISQDMETVFDSVKYD